MWDRQLTSRRRVVDADRLAGIDRVDAIAHADAWPDLVLATFRDLAGDMRIGEVGARHADHVEFAAFNRVPRCRHILDARRVEGRHLRRGANFAGKVEMRRGAGSHAGDDVRKRLVRVDMAADHIDEVDEARGGEKLCDRHALLTGKPALPVLVAHHPHADEKTVADALADRSQHVEAETHPVFQGSAVGVIAPIGRGRPELIDQMAVALELHPIEPGRIYTLGAVGVGLDHPRNVPVLHDFWESAVRRLANARRRDDRQPVRLAPARAPAEMRDLDHHCRPMGVHIVGELPEPAHNLVPVEQDVSESLRAVRSDDGGAADHRQRDATLRLLGVIEPIAGLRHTVFGIGRLVRRRHEPVSQGEVLELKGLEQRIVRHRLNHPSFQPWRISPASPPDDPMHR